jgi:hypothetical protein
MLMDYAIECANIMYYHHMLVFFGCCFFYNNGLICIKGRQTSCRVLYNLSNPLGLKVGALGSTFPGELEFQCKGA